MPWSPRLEAVRRALAELRGFDALDALEQLEPDRSGTEALQVEILRLRAKASLNQWEPEALKRVLDEALGTPYEGEAYFIWAMQAGPSRPLEYHRRLAHCAEVARREGDRSFEMQVLIRRGFLLMREGRFEEAGPLVRRAAEQLEALGAHAEAVRGWAHLVHLYIRQNEPERALATVEHALDLARPYPVLAAFVLFSRAGFESLQRQDETAERTLHEALRALGRTRSPVVRAELLAHLGDAIRRQGRLDEAKHYLEKALDNENIAYRSFATLNLALVELDLGNTARAREMTEPLLHAAVTANRAFATLIQLGACASETELDTHLDRLDALEELHVSADPDALRILTDSMNRWTPRDPTRAARLGLHAYHQRHRLGQDLAALKDQLASLRRAGAPLPLGPLELHAPVTRGGMGQVWRGEVRNEGVPIAIKVLATAQAKPQVAAALRREARAIARLDHPHIVPLVDLGQIPEPLAAMSEEALAAETPWLATLWAPHGTLQGWCGTRPWSQIRDALVQLLDALAAAHAADLLHLDVKPANVLVADLDPLRTWLADFGIASALGARADGAPSGTPAYLAPEQALGKMAEWGPWTDLYAVGATAVALVQGALPFEGTPTEMIQQHLQRSLPPLRPAIPIPAGLQRWCEHMMAKDPAQRYPCAADAAAALLALGEASGTEASPRPIRARADTTFLLDSIDLDALEPPPPAPDEDETRPLPVAPMRAHPPDLLLRKIPPTLASGAWRMLPLRRPPLVGLRSERAFLWKALWQVQDGASVVRLRAPTGGRMALMRWLAEAARRSGAAHVLWVSDRDRHPWPASLDAQLQPEPMALQKLEVLSHTRRVLVCIASHTLAADALVNSLLDALPHLPILVVGPDGAVSDRPSVQTLTLSQVTPDDMGELIDAMVPLAPSLRSHLLQSSGTDPATAIWTLRSWLADRALTSGAEGLVQLQKEPAPTSLPMAIERLLQPVYALDPAHRPQVQLAAILGEQLTKETWERACAAMQLPLRKRLPTAILARGAMVERGTQLAWADGIRETVVDAIPKNERPELHRAAAQAETSELRRQRVGGCGDPESAPRRPGAQRGGGRL